MTRPDSRPPTRPAESGSRDRTAAGRWALVIAPMVPVLVGVVARLLAPPHITGDVATIELDLRDLGQDWWTTGAWSRFGFRHPGPALVYLWAVPYRVLGSTATAFSITAALTTAPAFGFAVWLARRVGGLPAMAGVSLAALLLAFGAGSDLALDPWNPNPVAALTLVAVVGAAVAWRGGALGAAVAVSAASVAWQAHAGAVGLVVVIVPVCVAATLRHRRRWWASTRERWTLVAAVAVPAVLWAPPLWDQFGGSGNLGRLLGGGTTGAAGPGVAARLAFRAWSIDAWWLHDSVVAAGPGERLGVWQWVPLLLVPVVPAAVVLVRAARRHDGDEGVGAVLAVAVAVATVGSVTVARMDPWVFGYLIWWLPAAVATAVGVSVAVLVERAAAGRARRRRAPRTGGPTGRWALVAVVLLAMVPVGVRWRSVDIAFTDCVIGPPAEEAARRLEALGLGDGTVVEAAPDLVSVWSAVAVMLELDRAGSRWFGGPTLAAMLRPERTADPRTAPVVVRVQGTADPTAQAAPNASTGWVTRLVVPIEARPDGCGAADVAAIPGGGDPALVVTVQRPVEAVGG